MASNEPMGLFNRDLWFLRALYWSNRARLWRLKRGLRERVSIAPDCDSDALLVLVRPHGPTCHRGTTSCFDP